MLYEQNKQVLHATVTWVFVRLVCLCGLRACVLVHAKLPNQDECLNTAVKSIGVTPGPSWVGSRADIPTGCSIRDGGDMSPHWNTASSGRGRSDLRPVCKSGVTSMLTLPSPELVALGTVRSNPQCSSHRTSPLHDGALPS